jgi:UDPglucose 6-dehydrogenase
MNFINAELTKLAVNTFVTTKITFANMLAHICERLPEADVDIVTSALGLDSRIGRKYLRGAIGYGGPCFPRDNVAIASLARQIGAPATLAEATDRANRGEVHRLAGIVRSKLLSGGTVGILGLSYKPNTDVVDESQGVLLAQVLAAEGFSVIVYDPAAMDNARRVLKDSVRLAKSLEECVQQADVVVITTPWEVFSSLEPELLERCSRTRVLIDCWRILNPQRLESVVVYVPLGVGKR